MKAEVVDLSYFLPPATLDNGARQALMDVIPRPQARCFGDWDAPACVDWIILTLWNAGFKVVPLETEDLAV